VENIFPSVLANLFSSIIWFVLGFLGGRWSDYTLKTKAFRRIFGKRAGKSDDLLIVLDTIETLDSFHRHSNRTLAYKIQSHHNNRRCDFSNCSRMVTSLLLMVLREVSCLNVQREGPLICSMPSEEFVEFLLRLLLII